MHHHYHNGMEVNTPSGRGKVSNIVGSTVTVQLDNGQAQDFQINVLDKQYRDDVFSKMPNLGASFEKGKSKLANEDKKTEVVKKLKEYFSKKKKKTEAVDMIKAKTPDGEESVIATVPAGKGAQKAAQLKSQGITTAISKTYK